MKYNVKHYRKLARRTTEFTKWVGEPQDEYNDEVFWDDANWLTKTFEFDCFERRKQRQPQPK